MSLITSCPACETLFKAVPDQLRIADGWVRCGRCKEVFNATEHLLAQDVITEPELPHATPSTTTSGDGELQLEMQPTIVRLESDSPSTELAPSVMAPVDPPGEFGFLRQNRAEGSSRHRGMRALLSCVVGLLLLGLAGQIVFHERDRLLALKPELKPWLHAFCAPLNCRLSALQQRDSITVDGAAFTKITRNSYRLNFTVKNTSNLVLALPSVELTLTDASERPVLRRVFTPAEFELKADTLAAGSEWSASLAVLVNPADTLPPIVGYRLYVFYL